MTAPLTPEYAARNSVKLVLFRYAISKGWVPDSLGELIAPLAALLREREAAVYAACVKLCDSNEDAAHEARNVHAQQAHRLDAQAIHAAAREAK